MQRNQWLPGTPTDVADDRLACLLVFASMRDCYRMARGRSTGLRNSHCYRFGGAIDEHSPSDARFPIGEHPRHNGQYRIAGSSLAFRDALSTLLADMVHGHARSHVFSWRGSLVATAGRKSCDIGNGGGLLGDPGTIGNDDRPHARPEGSFQDKLKPAVYSASFSGRYSRSPFSLYRRDISSIPSSALAFAASGVSDLMFSVAR